MRPVYDFRQGDADDDRYSPHLSPLWRLAGALVAEFNLLRFLVSLLITIVSPLLIIGAVPLCVSIVVDTALMINWTAGYVVIVAIGVLMSVALPFWRVIWRGAETAFWNTFALFVQPSYMLGREFVRHVIEVSNSDAALLLRRRAIGAQVAGLGISLSAAAVAYFLWRYSQWRPSLAEETWLTFIAGAVANGAFVFCVYLAIAAPVWGFLDAQGQKQVWQGGFDDQPPNTRAFRFAHLSDTHVVCSAYAYRVESGRSGPQGNEALRRVLATLSAEDRRRHLDAIFLTGDMVDTGTSAEWAVFFDLLEEQPELASKLFILPGNHDLNVVDARNPARFEFPFSERRTFRLLRILLACNRLQGERVHVWRENRLSTLAALMGDRSSQIETFMGRGGRFNAIRLNFFFHSCFPMVSIPENPAQPGVIFFNSNPDNHFSFTNALGLVSSEQFMRAKAILDENPDRCFIVALHHHLSEYPFSGQKMVERLGTAAVNGTWLLRQLTPYANRILVVHGHRHIDWAGRWADIRILSAPSAVMPDPRTEQTGFHIHTVYSADTLRLGKPVRIVHNTTRQGDQGLTWAAPDSG